MKLACSAGRQALVLVALSILWPACRGALAPAELLFRNGAVYTVNPAEPWAQAVAVSSGRIVAVGSDEDVASWVWAPTRGWSISRAGCCSPVSATLTSTR